MAPKNSPKSFLHFIVAIAPIVVLLMVSFQLKLGIIGDVAAGILGASMGYLLVKLINILTGQK
ncbi:hypothetical protein HY501_01480 [Candidatus Woesearchaeota archaeon]|nr:hypothetical protein [Candidatus Woesearchaeota archaeon]